MVRWHAAPQVRNPLATISAGLECIEPEGPTEVTRDLVGTMLHSLGAASKILDDTLSLQVGPRR